VHNSGDSVVSSRGVNRFFQPSLLVLYVSLPTGNARGRQLPWGVKVAVEYFQPKELATAVSVINSGSGIGAMIPPAVSSYLILQFGWRPAFVLLALPALQWIPFLADVLPAS
jgi:ACS family hexuronate transporter-like MFS transporter